MANPHPQPTALKVLKGNPGKRALPKDEPQPDLISPDLEPPARLAPAGQQEWREMLPVLCRMRVMTEADLRALEMYCKATADEIHAEEMIIEHGKVQTAQSGHQQITAWYTVAEKARALRLKIISLFGLTPSDRTKVKTVAAPKKKNPFAQ